MGKGGKSKGKLFFSVALAVAGAFLGGATNAIGWSAITGASVGLSIGSTLWSVFSKPKFDVNDSDYSNDDYSRFNNISNDVNPDAVIPVIYGTRKFGGLQTWYNPYNGNRNLEKDVVVCCSGIDGIYNVCANEELIKDNTNISIYNEQYTDATVSRNGKTLTLSANNTTLTYTLGNTKNYDAQTSLLATVIDKIKSEAGNGWKIDGAVDDRTSKGISADSMKFTGSANCYVNPLDKERTGAVVLDDRGYSIGSYEFYQDETPDNYMDVGSYNGCAWIRSNLIASSRLSGSNPTINSYVKGMKVKVLKENQWSVEYSENPAWIIYDFLINPIYGTGRWIKEEMLDLPSFIETANYCDEEIEYKDFDGTTKTCPRYTLNIILDSKKEPIEHLSSMLAVFGGFFTIGNKISLKVEKAETPVYSFDDDTIVADSMSITQMSLDDTPNRYRIGYFEPSQNWTEIKVVVEDLELQHEQEEQINEKSVTLAGCTSQNQALRIGRLYRDLNKVCAMTISFSVATQGMMLECGDVITVTYGGIFTNMPFRITEIQETNSGIYQLTCRQYNASVYNDSMDATIVNPSFTDIKSELFDTIPIVTGLTLTEENIINTDDNLLSNIIVSWDDTKYQNFGSYLVSLSTDGDNYKSIANTFDTTIRIPNVTVGQKYWVSVQNINSIGFTSNPAIETLLLVGDGITPTTPTNISIKIGNDFHISWNKVANTSIKYYEVRTNTNVGNASGLLGQVAENELSTNLITSRQGTIYVYAVSIYNIYSNPAQYTYNYPSVKLTGLTVNAKIQGVELVANTVPNNYNGVHWYIDGTNLDYDYKTSGNRDFFSCEAGVYTVNACYYDYFGDGELYDAEGNGITVTASAYISPDMIESESITVEKLSEDTQKAIEEGGLDTVNIAVQGLLGEGSALTLQPDGSYALVASNGEKLTGLFANQDGVIRLQGDYIDITGTTRIGNNIISNNMIQTNAISADKLNVSSLSSITATIGTLRTATTGARTEIKDNLIEVYDSNNILRVRMGVW